MIASVIKFDQRGRDGCLYTEALDLSSIGPLQIARASNIEFNKTTQQWKVRGTAGKPITNHVKASTNRPGGFTTCWFFSLRDSF